MSRVDEAAKEEILRDLVDEGDKRFRRVFAENVLEQGIFTTDQNKPQQRLTQYMMRTLPDDLPMVLSEDYWKGRRLGIMPPLLSELLWQQYQEQAQMAAMAEQQAQMAQMQGLPPEMVPQAPPVQEPGGWRFWPLLIAGGVYKGQEFQPAPLFVIEHIAADMRKLVNTEMRRLQEEAA